MRNLKSSATKNKLRNRVRLSCISSVPSHDSGATTARRINVNNRAVIAAADWTYAGSTPIVGLYAVNNGGFPFLLLPTLFFSLKSSYCTLNLD